MTDQRKPTGFIGMTSASGIRRWGIRVTIWNVYMLICTLLLVITGLACLLIYFTPLPSILGHADERLAEQDRRWMEQFARLNDRVIAQEQYIRAMQQRVSGDPQENYADARDEELETDDTFHLVARSPLVDSLRIVVERTNVEIPVRLPLAREQRSREQTEARLLVPPVAGTLSNPFDAASGHVGVDLVAPDHSAVMAALEGIVIECDWTLTGGNTIIIQHDEGWMTVYKHNAALLKQKGDQVKAGEAIAIIGNTGLHTDGAHVHFELWHEGKPIDPALYMAL